MNFKELIAHRDANFMEVERYYKAVLKIYPIEYRDTAPTGLEHIPEIIGSRRSTYAAMLAAGVIPTPPEIKIQLAILRLDE